MGPDDPTTHEPRVYLLYHNLGSGSAQHNMFVVTSRDGGATFDAPVPITDPLNSPQAYQDLQCADSGGPSSLSVNPRTGRVYAVWGTRSAPFAGGCGASVFGPFEINVVAATRVWVATSPDNSMGSWRTVKVVDDTATNRIVGMQLSPATLDRKGNKLSWKLTFSNLTSPATGAGLRGPQTPGGEAGVLYDLSPGGVRSGATGSANLNEGELRYLVQDRLYVQILTAKYPAGEIRGQILKERPTCNAGKKTT